MVRLPAIVRRVVCVSLLGAAACVMADTPLVPVNATNFVRAETDMYLARSVAQGAFGKFVHLRTMADIDHQDVIRMNRDTIYSSGVFDLAAGPVTVTLPDPGKRFMSLLLVSEDHYNPAVVYAPGRYTFTQEQVGTRYVQMIVRTLANPESAEDMKGAHALQDAIRVEQASPGTFEIPNWDPVTRDKARDAISALAALGGEHSYFGKKGEVDPVDHLLGTAVGWGGNPPSAAMYAMVVPAVNDGKTSYQLTVKDVPVDGFWSLSVYNEKGFFEKNDLGAYSINNLTAKPNKDGSVTIRFGGCGKGVANCLPISPGWNYTARMYRPRPEVIDGTWKFPAPEPVR